MHNARPKDSEQNAYQMTTPQENRTHLPSPALTPPGCSDLNHQHLEPFPSSSDVSSQEHLQAAMKWPQFEQLEAVSLWPHLQQRTVELEARTGPAVMPRVWRWLAKILENMFENMAMMSWVSRFLVRTWFVSVGLFCVCECK